MILCGIFLIFLTSVQCADEGKSLAEEMPEICRDIDILQRIKGEEFFKHMGFCGLERLVLQFKYNVTLPSAIYPENECTYSKIREVPTPGRLWKDRMVACILRGLIGKDPKTLSYAEIRNTIKENYSKLLESSKKYALNCSNRDFSNFTIDSVLQELARDDECLIIELIKQSANA